ncbi:hypothetical protein ACFR99_08055 [Haloarchaeobius amylolyticus]|uniref:Twin-arginine translocation signal domain-containing protein n=1 Tax=Haloarchaeobius amylolyticus TaxID=1198296 RepID=A0ABD6BF01_9EURY
MNRRTFITTATAGAGIVVAGCVGDTTEEPDPEADDTTDSGTDNQTDDEVDSEPEPEPEPEPMFVGTEIEELIPDFTQENPTHDELVRDDELNENFDAIFITEDEQVAVMVDVEIESSIEDADGRMQTRRDRVSEYHEFTLEGADDAFWYEEPDNARTYVRLSNGVGEVVAGRMSESDMIPDVNRSQEYAIALIEHWQTI